MSREHIATYLNDHLSSAVVTLELLEHLETEVSDSISDLRALRVEVEADRQQLRVLMDRLSIPESRIRKVTSWIAEQFAEAKFEADDESKGNLHRLERLEALSISLDRKAALWRALKSASEIGPELRELDYDKLIQRAQQQRARVESWRLQAARSALVPKIV